MIRVLVIPCNTPRMYCFQAELIVADCRTRVTTSQAPEVLMFSTNCHCLRDPVLRFTLANVKRY